MSFAINRTFKTFKDDISGQFGMWTAVLAFPVLLSASMVVDMRVAEAHRSNIQRALDATSMAVASNNQISDAQKVQFANSVFNDNYQGDLTVDLDVIVEPNTIELNATAEMPTSINGALGKGSIEIKQGSKAAMQQKNTICVLALAPTGRNRVSFLGNSDFDSPTCAVQANSSD